ncbi:MAG: ParB/RepB/Spo0J family partition protein [Alphaproteobacteria bacterium]|nr:MAG: ParB/RepB/Spo0J family partition protein [Alphaproteobacteria bacterium]
MSGSATAKSPKITKPEGGSGRAPLGRGLSALFGEEGAAAPATAGRAGSPIQVNLTRLKPSHVQPRHHFDEKALGELADSIRERGILQPLLVRPAPGAVGHYEILAGERRWRAAQLAGLHEVPVVVRAMEDVAALEAALIENIQREDLEPLEEAEGYRRLMQEYQHTQETMAKVVGKSRPHIANMLRLLNLPEAVKTYMRAGLLSAGHARALLAAADPAALAKQVVDKGLSVRQTESLARRSAEGKGGKATGKTKSTNNVDTQAIEKELAGYLGLKVEIKGQGATGSLTLHYKTLDQLDDVLNRLSRPLPAGGPGRR